MKNVKRVKTDRIGRSVPLVECNAVWLLAWIWQVRLVGLNWKIVFNFFNFYTFHVSESKVGRQSNLVKRNMSLSIMKSNSTILNNTPEAQKKSFKTSSSNFNTNGFDFNPIAIQTQPSFNIQCSATANYSSYDFYNFVNADTTVVQPNTSDKLLTNKNQYSFDETIDALDSSFILNLNVKIFWLSKKDESGIFQQSRQNHRGLSKRLRYLIFTSLLNSESKRTS